MLIPGPGAEAAPGDGRCGGPLLAVRRHQRHQFVRGQSADGDPLRVGVRHGEGGRSQKGTALAPRRRQALGQGTAGREKTSWWLCHAPSLILKF